jgi:hypothetical protein
MRRLLGLRATPYGEKDEGDEGEETHEEGDHGDSGSVGSGPLVGSAL